MADRQLRLFPAPRPLVERLGAEFFRSVPAVPGVYRILGEGGRLLYVGKAADLRARLSAYRRTHGHGPRTIRLLHAARAIEWQTCPDERSALLLENHLLRTLRPPFNRAGTWPAAARYVVLETLADGFQLVITDDPFGECYGAFRAPGAEGLAALARLVWLASRRRIDVASLPRRLLASPGLRQWRFTGDEAEANLPGIRSLLSGDGGSYIADLLASIPVPPSPFETRFLEAQIEMLLHFHERGPARNARLRAAAGPGRRVISPEEHDDLLILASRPERRPVRAGKGQTETALTPTTNSHAHC